MISVNVIIWATLNQFRLRNKKAKKLVSLAIGGLIATGFGYVDYKHSQGDFAENSQKLFLSFVIAVFLYDYTIKFVMDFFKRGKSNESNN